MWRTLTSNFKSNEVDPIKVDIQKLIKFYDEDSSVQPHSNAIKTLAGEELANRRLVMPRLNHLPVSGLPFIRREKLPHSLK